MLTNSLASTCWLDATNSGVKLIKRRNGKEEESHLWGIIVSRLKRSEYLIIIGDQAWYPRLLVSMSAYLRRDSRTYLDSWLKRGVNDFESLTSTLLTNGQRIWLDTCRFSHSRDSGLSTIPQWLQKDDIKMNSKFFKNWKEMRIGALVELLHLMWRPRWPQRIRLVEATEWNSFGLLSPNTWWDEETTRDSRPPCRQVVSWP